MKDLLICVLATIEVFGIIYAMSRRSRLDAEMIPARYIRVNGETKLVEASTFNQRAFE